MLSSEVAAVGFGQAVIGPDDGEHPRRSPCRRIADDWSRDVVGVADVRELAGRKGVLMNTGIAPIGVSTLHRAGSVAVRDIAL